MVQRYNGTMDSGVNWCWNVLNVILLCLIEPLKDRWPTDLDLDALAINNLHTGDDTVKHKTDPLGAVCR